MQRLDIAKIIAYLNTQTSVTSLVANRIYWGIPKGDQAGSFLVLSEITEIQDTVEVTSRVELRMIAKDDNTKWSELYAIERAVSNLIAQNGGVDFVGFKANKIVLDQNVFQGYDDKTRKTYVRDYLFYYNS